MTRESPQLGALLTINTGSSSVKLAVYGNEPRLPALLQMSVERIGRPGTRLEMTRSGQNVTFSDAVEAKDHRGALAAALDRAHGSTGFTVEAIGHRIVHGGATHAGPERLTAALVSDLRELTAIDPSHMPQALAAIDAVGSIYPHAPQVACFDTSFHRTMPPIAQRYALPAWTAAAGVRRYGFHGLSCEFIVSALERVDPGAIQGRLLIAHLGNGASVTAVHRGTSVETTMGFSPTGGLMMGTRCGDIDPTVLTYLARTTKSDADALQRLVTDEAGLLGASGVSADVRDLLARPDSLAATEAIELFCYTASKHIGALATVLDGIDTLVFTGGIGEHAAPVREQICRRLGHLGVRLDLEQNAANHEVISAPGSAVLVRVMHTDEQLMIARHVRSVLA